MGVDGAEGAKAPEKSRKPRNQGSCLGFCPGKGKGAFLAQKSSQATDRGSVSSCTEGKGFLDRIYALTY